MTVCDRTVVFEENDVIRQVNVDSGVEGKQLPCHGHFVAGDGVIVHAIKPNQPQVSDASTGKLRVKLEKPKADAFMLAACSIDRAVTLIGGSLVYDGVIWDAKTGKVLFEHNQKTGVDETEVSPDGKIALIVRAKKPTLIVDTKTMAITPLPELKPRTLCKVVWAADSKTAVMFTYTEGLVFDVKTRKVVGKLKLKHARSCTFVPGREVFLAANGRRISIFSTKTWKETGTIELPAELIGATGNGDRIVIAEENVAVSVWDAATLLGAGKPIVKKPKSGKPAKRQVRAIFWGVPKKVPEKKIIEAVTTLHYILDNQPAEFAVRILPADKTRDRHWFHIVGSRGRNYLLEPWIECMQTDFKVPLDVVMHIDIVKKVEARRYTTPFDGEAITVAPDYLAALDVADPVLVIEGGRKAGKRVTPKDISGLAHCVELRWP